MAQGEDDAKAVVEQWLEQPWLWPELRRRMKLRARARVVFRQIHEGKFDQFSARR